MVGVTGTNGKTTITQWIAQALDQCGRRCALVGTLGNGFLTELEPGPNTTPGAQVLAEILPDYVRRGAQACAMEVSSIGLHQNRVADIRFDVAVFTNLTRDHLEYHPTMAAYGAEKAKLFAWPGLAHAVLNLDDPFGQQLAANLKGRIPTMGYTLQNATGTDRVLRAANLAETTSGIDFTLDHVRCALPVVGRFNAANALAVVGVLLAGGIALERCAEVLRHLEPPPGRMQTLGGQGAPLVVVDYAHTPDALDQVLAALRGAAAARGGKLVCVFGCGGDRDPGKRPQMGRIAAQRADVIVVTSDNPRSENPQAIIDAIIAGMTIDALIQPDRGVAIAAAIRQADARDVILLAGKGHEPYQEVAGVRLPFSDVAAAKSALARRQGGAAC